MTKIFVTVGSQKFQFNRLLSEIDKLDMEKYKVFAQIGYSDYKPQNYEYVDFMPREKFNEELKSSDLVVTHAGTGVIITSLTNNKKVLAVTRLRKYKEHVDDHQTEILDVFKKKKYINGLIEIDNLDEEITKTISTEYEKFQSNTDNFIKNLIFLIDK